MFEYHSSKALPGTQLCYVVHCISIARLWHQLRLSKFGPLSCICICPGSLHILTICAQIPPHGRWRHLDAGRPRVEPLVAKWKASPNPPDTKEICRRLIDLFLERLKGGQDQFESDEERAQWRDRLEAFLRTSPNYNRYRVLKQLPPDGK